MAKKQKLDELINKAEPAWPELQQLLKAAKNHVEVLPAKDPQRADALVAAQVTTRSPMGAIVYETGGLLVDHGWIRILGSGHEKLPRSLPQWNIEVGVAQNGERPPFVLIADDVVGGFYALDGGELGKEGNVFYFPPDNLEWEDTETGYKDFLHFCLNGKLDKFYENHRWPGWKLEVSKLPGDQGIQIVPYLWNEGPSIENRKHSQVPVKQLYNMFVGGEALD
jgi:hypothetical protein